MNLPELTSKHNYASGEEIEVDESSLKSLIEKGEEVLGLESREREIEILYLPQQITAITGVRGGYSAEEKKFAFPKQQHEATLFHEGIHYLMSEEGLLFGPSLEKATFYDRLVDETIAEFATSGVYGYNEFASDLMGFYEKFRKGEAEALEMFGEQFVSELSKEMMPLIKETIQEMDFPQLEIVKKQREIERKYKETNDFEAITEDVGSLYELIDSLSGPFTSVNFAEAVRILAIDKAIRLGKSEVQPKDLAAWLKDGVAKGWDSYGLYFFDIVGVISPSE